MTIKGAKELELGSKFPRDVGGVAFSKRNLKIRGNKCWVKLQDVLTGRGWYVLGAVLNELNYVDRNGLAGSAYKKRTNYDSSFDLLDVAPFEIYHDSKNGYYFLFKGKVYFIHDKKWW